MASEEPPSKRPRLHSENGDKASADTDVPSVPLSVMQDERQVAKEASCGITAFVNPQTATFSGILKQRYTDFLVNEILPDGTVLRFRGARAPKAPKAHPRDADADAGERSGDRPEQSASEPAKEPAPTPEAQKESSDGQGASEDSEVTPEEIGELVALFGQSCVDSVLKLFQAVVKSPQRQPRSFDSVLSPAIDSRPGRTEAHQLVRRVFKSRLETQTQDDNTIKFLAAPRKQSHASTRQPFSKNQPHGKLGWEQLGGEYVHFTLYKENKDTMESIAFLASQTRTMAKRFQFSGTKDRRAVTVQRVSAMRIHADELDQVGRRLRFARIGDYTYRPRGLQLGELGGNEFVITLRDCHFPGEEGLDLEARLRLAEQTLGDTVPAFQRDGFLNYYGLQRFGSFRSGTDQIGMKMLQGDLKGAVDDILAFSADALAAAQNEDSTLLVSNDDKKRAVGLHLWQTQQDHRKALGHIPSKFSAECNIVRTLGSKKNKGHQHDFQGALGSIPRALRLMYVHAYQSLVWNTVAAERWRLFGSKVIEGDLVLVDHSRQQQADPEGEVDEAGEPVIKPAADDAATSAEDQYTRARPLTKQEAESGDFGIFDVVLPLPGYDVEYPKNAIGTLYETFMASPRGGQLDPHNMRRAWKDISLSGGYRSFLARPLAPMSYEVKSYVREEEQLAETDVDRLQQQRQQQQQQQTGELGGEEDSRVHAGGSSTKTKSDEDTNSAEVKVAVLLKLQLGPSQYATMALRELLGAGGLQMFKAEYGGGRS